MKTKRQISGFTKVTGQAPPHQGSLGCRYLYSAPVDLFQVEIHFSIFHYAIGLAGNLNVFCQCKLTRAWHH